VFATLGGLPFKERNIEWVALHRIHHAYTDVDEDPHTPSKSFWRGHMFWVFERDPRVSDSSLRFRWVKDLCDDPYIVFLERWPVVLQVALMCVLYLIGEAVGRGLGLAWCVYGGFVRITVLQHVTWLVNSAAHKWGYRNTETKDQSTNNWVVALLTFGEGWHNNHHAMPRSASFARRWFELDLGFLIIRSLERLGLVWDVVVPERAELRSQTASQE